MTKDITAQEIILIHNVVENKFKTSKGFISKGLLESIADKPNQVIDNKLVYDTIFLKVSCILEGIIRLHPFVDGNKRTALLVLYIYLNQNGYGFAAPLNILRYLVNIAEKTENDEQDNNKLIKDISKWIKKHSAKTKLIMTIKYYRYISNPFFFHMFLNEIGFKKYAKKKIEHWMAFDLYPEDEDGLESAAQIMFGTMNLSYNNLNIWKNKSS